MLIVPCEPSASADRRSLRRRVPPLGALVIDGMGNAILDPIRRRHMKVSPLENVRYDLIIWHSWNWSQISSILIKRRANFQRFLQDRHASHRARH